MATSPISIKGSGSSVGETVSGEQGEYRQAEFYYNFFTRLKEEKENGANLACVTFWGLTDDASWRKGANPLLFRGDLEPKPAFDALVMAAEGEPFSLSQTGVTASSLSEHIDFEPYKENGKTVTVPPDSVGFFSRGAGHQSTLVLVNTENHTEDAVIGFALRVQRAEPDATVKKEINSFIGASVDITMHIKTEDKEIILGLEGTDTQELARVSSDGEWTEVKASAGIPSDWQRGDTKKGPMILACAFYEDGGKWVGGKFDWIDEARASRPLENIHTGYGGWNAAAWAAAKRRAFCVMSADGRHRSNLLEETR